VVIFALAVTIYFWWQNTKGIEESSESPAVMVTTVMAVILLGWVAITPVKQGYQHVPLPTPGNLKFSPDPRFFTRHQFRG
jgi:hypothetical protein